MRSPFRGPWPTGVIGMFGLVLAVELLYVARHDRDFTTHWAQTWKWSGRAATREAPGSAVLVFGDSLALHDVVPGVIEGRLGRKAYNLAVFKGQAPSTYFLFRRALGAGAKPAAVLVDGEVLDQDPTTMTRLWPELAGFADCAELALEARSPAFFGAMAVAKILPSYKARWEIRSCVLAAFEGRSATSRYSVKPRQRNSERNRGAQVLPVPGGDYGRAAEVAEYVPLPWKVHPLNAAFTEKFLALADARGVPVYWLLPPYYPGVQARRDASGWTASYMDFVKGLQARHPNLVVIDGRHADYTPGAIADLTHLNRLGAVAFSDAVAGILQNRIGGARPPSESQWVTIPPYRPPADATAVEDVGESLQIVKRLSAMRSQARR